MDELTGNEEISKSELLRKIKRRFGSLDNDRGCYSNGRWLSVASIECIINEYSEDIDVCSLLDDIENKYGDLDNDRGCYSDGRWLSVAAVVDLIKSCI